MTDSRATTSSNASPSLEDSSLSSPVLTLSASEFEGERDAAETYVKQQLQAFKEQSHGPYPIQITVNLSLDPFTHDHNDTFVRGFSRAASDIAYYRKRDPSMCIKTDLAGTTVSDVSINAGSEGGMTADIIRGIRDMGCTLDNTTMRATDQIDAKDSVMWEVASTPTGISDMITTFDLINLGINGGFAAPGPKDWPRRMKEQHEASSGGTSEAPSSRPFFVGIVSDVKATDEHRSFLDNRTVSVYIDRSDGEQRQIDIGRVRAKITGTFATKTEGTESGFNVTNRSEGGEVLERYLACPSEKTRSKLLSHLRSMSSHSTAAATASAV